MRIMLAWIGRTDMDASKGDIKAGLGPIGQAVAEREFDKIMLLCNYDKAQMSAYKNGSPRKLRLPLKFAISISIRTRWISAKFTGQ